MIRASGRPKRLVETLAEGAGLRRGRGRRRHGGDFRRERGGGAAEAGEAAGAVDQRDSGQAVAAAAAAAQLGELAVEPALLGQGR
jgi:hypothetical protein